MRRCPDLSIYLVLDPGLCAGVGMVETARAAVASGLYVSMWTESGYRGVYKAAPSRDPLKPWEALLPKFRKSIQAHTQVSLGFFAEPLQAAQAFADAVRETR